MSKFVRNLIRVACYIRVSTEEQKKNGLSVEAQIARLKEYLKEHTEYILVDFYIDNGISSVKLNKRLELQRLLNDVRNDKVDLILFTRLDRWGRNVKYYYQVQDVLDEHNVTWKAVDEDYETETANGKFTVNVMMSIAQHERDKDSERIKDVFVNKVKNGEALYGNNATPFGFEIREVDGKKKMVHNLEQEPILHALIEYYYTFKSKRKAMMFAQEKFGIYLLYETVSKLFANTLLYGSYRGNDNYCEPYITKEKWDELQRISEKNIKVRKTKNTYIFSGLIVCPVCGRNLVGFSTCYKSADGKPYKRMNYRCDGHYTRLTCDFKKTKSEPKLEKQLLENLSLLMEDYIIDCEMKQKKQPPKKKINVDAVKEEMDRLNNMFLKGRIDEEFYDEKYKALSDKLKEADIEEIKNKPSEKVKELRDINLGELYDTFSQEEKQAFWTGLINSVYVDENYNITKVDFL